MQEATVGEAIIVVCDVCGEPAVETVSVRAGRLNRQKDVCQPHLDALFKGSRAPKRGRRRATAAPVAAKRRGRSPKASAS